MGRLRSRRARISPLPHAPHKAHLAACANADGEGKGNWRSGATRLEHVTPGALPRRKRGTNELEVDLRGVAGRGAARRGAGPGRWLQEGFGLRVEPDLLEGHLRGEGSQQGCR